MSDTDMSDSPERNDSPERASPAVSPGARLAACREERGWTIEQVASYLNLAPRQVIAMERDDYAALPGIAVTRGFIRAYAKLLRIDAAPLLAEVGGEEILTGKPLAPAKTLSTPFSQSRLPAIGERSGIPFKWIVGALLLILAAVGFWAAQRSGDFGSLSQVGMPSGTQDKQAPYSETNSQSAAPAAQAPEPAPLPGSSDSVQPPATPAPSGSAPAEQAATQPATAGEGAANGGKAESGSKTDGAGATAGKDVLVLSARQDSWVEIRQKANDKVVSSKLMKAGTTESFDVREPLSLTVGNAAGIDITLRGQAIEVKGNANSNVARLTVK